MENKVLIAENIHKKFRSGDGYLAVLKGADLELEPGKLAVLSGSSGSGKSTLLYILGGLEKPDTGHVIFQGQRVNEYGNSQMDDYRNRKIGFVFQMHYLLPDFTAIENVMIPALIRGESYGVAKNKAQALLTRLFVAERQDHYPNQLSGGEQQRVAVARAMINSPMLIFADEPTGNLDRENATELLKLFQELVDDTGVCVLIATHDPELANMGRIKFHLFDGKVDGAKSAAIDDIPPA